MQGNAGAPAPSAEVRNHVSIVISISSNAITDAPDKWDGKLIAVTPGHAPANAVTVLAEVNGIVKCINGDAIGNAKNSSASLAQWIEHQITVRRDRIPNDD